MLDGTLFVVKCASTEIGEKTFSPILFYIYCFKKVCKNIFTISKRVFALFSIKKDGFLYFKC